MDSDPFLCALETSSVWEDGHVVVRLRGEADVTCADFIVDYLDMVLDQGVATIVVDLGALDFIDSSALAALGSATSRAAALGGRLILRRPSKLAEVILQVTSLGEVLEVEVGEEAPADLD